VTTQTYGVHINATPDAIWDAITTSEWTQQYGDRGGVEIVDGEVIESDPPRKLVLVRLVV
jgi:uncharacterized protein YndB with AHSA1/START domain